VVWLNKADDPARIAAGHTVAARLKKHRKDIEARLARQAPWPGRVVIASLFDPDPVKEVVIL
jgi:hypothetical protein